MAELDHLRIAYCQASRCWQSNNLRSCALICNSLTKSLNEFVERDKYEHQLAQLKHLVWFLKIKCLSEDYNMNESFLLNEVDIESDDQVQTFNATATTAAAANKLSDVRPTTAQPLTSTRRKVTGGSRMDTRGLQRTGVLTGRMPTRTSSRHSGYATTAYRPLTNSLTATQTAFSRSTRPLLKYSTCRFLSKPIYEYLYNAQNINNICPDYRQCLEYLNLVKSTRRKCAAARADSISRPSNQLIALSNEQELLDQKNLGAYWLLAFGVCYFHLKMHKQAEELFQTSSSVNKKYLDPYLWLIKVYLRLNQPSRVLKTCDEGSKNCRNAILSNWKARVQSLQGNSLAAHVSLRESLQFCPTNIEALANVGHYSFYGDKLELALKCFERINQLSMNNGSSGPQAGASDGLLSTFTDDSSAELFNNMALCHFQCGNYAEVMPLFQRAFLNSPNKEVTSNIWYNISFLPLSFGSRQLAEACLRMALKNDSQNEDAMNNLGVLKCDSLINDPLHYWNRQEYWASNSTKSTPLLNVEQFTNSKDQRRLQVKFDDAETFFGSSITKQQIDGPEVALDPDAPIRPEMLYNMAILKFRRGQMLASVRCCDLYLQYDQNDHIILSILEEINELISHDC